MVVHDVRQMVGRQVVCRFIQHFVVQYITIDDHFAANQIMHVYILVRLYFESNHIFLAAVHQSLYLLCRHRQRVTHLHTCTGIVLEIRNLSAFGFQLFRRVKSNIRMTAVQQLFHILMINLSTLTLPVWTVLADSFYLYLSSVWNR